MSAPPPQNAQFLVAWTTTSDGYLEPVTLPDGRVICGAGTFYSTGQDLQLATDATAAGDQMLADLLTRPGVREATIRTVIADP